VILVDTSVWIDFLNGHASGEAESLAQLIEENQPITVPGLVLTEILCGLRSDSEAERIANLLSAFDSTPEPARRDYAAAAGIYRSCRAQGQTIRSTIDCLIAQICLRYGYRLLSKDRDFDAIARYFPLQRLGPT
jgi:hypothetical protein